MAENISWQQTDEARWFVRTRKNSTLYSTSQSSPENMARGKETELIPQNKMQLFNNLICAARPTKQSKSVKTAHTCRKRKAYVSAKRTAIIYS